MGRKSRVKGSRGELSVARLISAWWMDDPSLRKAQAKELPIRRTPMSGGWSKAKGIGGDLVPVVDAAQDFPFSVEVKNNEKWSFDGMLKDDKWPVDKWWAQCLEAALEAGQIPLLIFTRNFMPWYVRLTLDYFFALQHLKDISSSLVIWNGGFVYMELSVFTRTFTKKDCLKACDA